MYTVTALDESPVSIVFQAEAKKEETFRHYTLPAFLHVNSFYRIWNFMAFPGRGACGIAHN